MKIEIRKIYRDSVDIKDYIVKKCIERNELLEITHGVDRMILTPLELEKDFINVSNIFESKIGGRNYRLVSYAWDPIQSEL